MSSADPRRQRDIRPSPAAPLHSLQRGSLVKTKFGAGKVTDIVLMLSDVGDRTQLVPPGVQVELDEPWQGETRVTIPLWEIRTPEGRAVWRKPTRMLWNTWVTDKPATQLRSKTVGSVLKALRQAANKCKDCGGALGKNSEDGLCERCRGEASAMDDPEWNDPQGTQFFTKIMRRQPMTGYNPVYGSPEGGKDVDARIVALLRENPTPDDKVVHDLAAELGMSPHDLEEQIYQMLAEKLS